MHPAIKKSSISRLSRLKGFLNAEIMNAYLPNISNMNDPLNPGNIIAQIAIVPLKKMNHFSLVVLIGIIPVIWKANIVPRINVGKEEKKFFIDLHRIKIEAVIKPKKKDHV